MEVVFRVDASLRIGTGHVYRCLALADALRQKGARSRFAHRLHRGNLAPLIRDRGYDVLHLREPELGARRIADGDYAAWLGVTQLEDAEETAAAIGDDTVDWVVVDHYALDSTWEERIAAEVDAVAVIDDLASRAHQCAVLLDQNYHRRPDSRYDGLVPDRTVRLCGPRYALLSEDYAEARRFLAPRRGPAARVLVFYGGSDPSDETIRAMRVLSREPFAHLAVDVVLGPNNDHAGEAADLAARRPRTTLQGPRRSLLDLMVQADVMLGAGGATTWERCAVGLPAIVTTIAKNQESFHRALHEDCLATYLGPADQIGDDELADALQRLVDDDAELARMAQRGWLVTDGLGARRMAEVLSPAASEDLSLRKAVTTDSSMLLEWPQALSGRCRPDGQPSATAPPNREATPLDARRHAWLLVTSTGLPVGQASVRLGDHRGLISYSVDRAFHGRGWRSRILQLLVAECQQAGLTTPLVLEDKRGDSTAIDDLPAAGYDDDSAATEERHSLTILSDRNSWMTRWIPALAAGWICSGHAVRWISRVADLEEGELCFLLSCGQVLDTDKLRKHAHNVVVHASELPKGRGWSPMTWGVLEGSEQLTVTMLEAVESVDAGPIYGQLRVALDGGELLDELRQQLARATIELCEQFVREFPASAAHPRVQSGEPSFYPRRTPKDSRIYPDRALAEQFDLLRVADSERYPAFFEFRGREYALQLRERKP